MLSKNKYLSLNEQKQLLDFWKNESDKNQRSKTILTLIEFALGSGLRISEIASIQINNLFIDDEYPHIKFQSKKNGTSNPVYISKGLCKILKDYIQPCWKQNRYLFLSEGKKKQSNTGLWGIWKRSLKKAGLSHYPFHSTRHTFATNLYRQSKDIRLTQIQLRHKSISSTQIYADVSAEDINKIMNQI